jgi:hypothetical protein
MTGEEEGAIRFVRQTIANLQKHMDIPDSRLNFMTDKVWQQQCEALARWEVILKMMLRSQA